ncbi:MAG: hypothetical protein ABSB82_03325 [Terriglobia bacterium]|jgi:hypothetical protein
MIQTVKDQIIEQVDRLAEPQQRQVLEFAQKLTPPRGVAGKDLVRFAGAIDPKDLEDISKVILEGCEKVDLNGW